MSFNLFKNVKLLLVTIALGGLTPQFSFAGPLRVASTNNSMAIHLGGTTGKTHHFGRWPVRIGSGDFSELVFSFNNWYFSGGGTSSPFSYTVESAALENESATLSVPIYFGGSRSLSVAPGANDVQSDPLLPQAFGLEKFSRGEVYFLKMKFIGVARKFPIALSRITSAYSGSQSLFVDPLVTSVSSVDQPGLFTTTGVSAPNNRGGVTPMVLGRFTSGDPTTWFGSGDSIYFGFSDTIITKNMENIGIFGRALIGDGNPNSLLAGFNFTLSGMTSKQFLRDPRLRYWIKYAKNHFNGLATNDFGRGPTFNSGAVAEATIQSLWIASYQSGAEKVIQAKCGPRTKSTDLFLSRENQTPLGVVGSGWYAGGPVDLFNLNLNSKVGIFIDDVVEMNAWRDPINPSVWSTNGIRYYSTGDGTHPSRNMTILLSRELREVMDRH